MATKVVYHENDNILEVANVKNAVTGAYINNANVQVTVYQTDGTTELTGVTWPLTVIYVSGSNGTYRITLPDTMDTAGLTGGVAKIIIDGGAGLKAEFWCVLEFKTRRCC